MTPVSRRRLIVLGAAGIAAPWVARAAEPEIRLKFGNIVSGDHPLNLAMGRVRDRVARETDGGWRSSCFPRTSSAPTPTC